MFYVILLACDILAIRAAFTAAFWIESREWLSPHGMDLGWLVVLLHSVVGLREAAYSHQAVQSRIESIRRAWRSLIFASALICTGIYFLDVSQQVSRLGLGSALLLSMAFVAVFRTLFLTPSFAKKELQLFGTLLITDGHNAFPSYRGDRINARATGLAPDILDPTQLARFAEAIRDYDRIVVSCPSGQKRSDWAQMLKCFNVTGEVILDDGNPLGAIAVDRFRGEDTAVVSRGALSLGSRFKKRVMDILVSAAALILLAPLLAAVAIAIKLDSKGPVFFAQPRVGRGNRLFKILKFRSMHAERCDHAGARSTARDDDRITRVGKIIRATSMDELPQLINVLKGDMSIVGPRPHALGSLAGDKLFWEVDTTYWRRHALKPGITGLAQVRGFRGATHRQADLQNRLQADLEYISGWSLWRDIKILVSTVRVVIHSEAY